ncbi:MAG TPA: cation:proton antiporter, partial [Candidatus Dormibacteraeota bacterium]|nr:cation:proton antiporter [Candidatus Dormibacteraeota bacterium]
MSDAQLSAVFFLQMACILVVCRAVGWVARKIGQPLVVGEMVAGVLLGPSLFGLFLPSAQSRLFPPESLKILYVTAQVGVGVYMFLIGLEFNMETLSKHLRSAASVSIAGMVVPFATGMGLALWLLKMPGLFSPTVSQTVAMLFLGTSMSITAFPVLARIIYERGLLGTSLGTLTLAAGAVADAAAWCVLAVVLAAFGAGNGMAVRAIVGGLVFVVVLVTIGRKLLGWFSASVERAGKLSGDRFALSLAGIMGAVWFTDTIGLHAVLGGFVLGLVLPRGLLAQELQRKLEPLVVVFMLPIFFAYSGL